MENFATFYANSIKNKNKKVKKGKYKGQRRAVIKKDLQLPGYMHYNDPSSSTAPSSSTFTTKG